MSDGSLTQRLDYEKVSENVDVDQLVEGTQWEDEISEDRPLGEALGAQVGSVVGQKIGESLGRTIGEMVTQELLESEEPTDEEVESEDEPERDQAEGTEAQA